MTPEEQKQKIKAFLKDFAYNIMHESNNNHAESYFVVITKEDTKNPLLKLYFDSYINKFPLENISNETQRYIKAVNQQYYFIYIDEIQHSDPFFKEKDSFIRENANNIISIRMIGEPADISAHISNQLEIYLEKFKGISYSATVIAKSKALEKFHQGKELIEEKKPIIEQKINSIKNKLKNITKPRL